MYKCYPVSELNSLNKTKSQIFQEIGFSFDCVLPQNWLDDFSEWCKLNHRELTYHLILSTTVWAYPPKFFNGLPISCCKEVTSAYKEYKHRG
jgi:hypothetical protein